VWERRLSLDFLQTRNAKLGTRAVMVTTASLSSGMRRFLKVIKEQIHPKRPNPSKNYRASRTATEQLFVAIGVIPQTLQAWRRKFIYFIHLFII
jgi:hypothetical protein